MTPSSRRRLGLATATALALGGCLETGDADTISEATSQSAALQYNGNGDPPDPNAAFLTESVLTPTIASNDITHTLDPAACSDLTNSFVTISRDSSKKYRTLFWNSGVRPNTWGIYADKQFNSSPACVMRENGRFGSRGFVLIGKGTDNKLSNSAGSWNPNLNPDGSAINPTPDNPSNPFTFVDSTNVYSNFMPAAASSGSSLALAIVDDAGKVFAYGHRLPFNGSSWTARKQAPALPSGAVATGRPAVSFFPAWGNYYQVAVRATVNGQNKLFISFFMVDTLSSPLATKWSGEVPGSPAQWYEVPVSGPIDSGPAIAWSPVLGTSTLYYRSGTRYKQTSSGTGSRFGDLPVGIVMPTESTQYASAPAAIGNQIEPGSETVFGRTTANQIFFTRTLSEEQLIP